MHSSSNIMLFSVDMLPIVTEILPAQPLMLAAILMKVGQKGKLKPWSPPITCWQDFTQARTVNSINDAVKTVSSGVHLQDARKLRLTPAAKQRQEVQNTMLSYIQRTATDADASDDELNLAFSSMAKSMHLHLSKTQKEHVSQCIWALVKLPQSVTVVSLCRIQGKENYY